MKYTQVSHVELQAIPGASFDQAISDGLAYGAENAVDVVVIHNDKRIKVTADYLWLAATVLNPQSIANDASECESDLNRCKSPQ